MQEALMPGLEAAPDEPLPDIWQSDTPLTRQAAKACRRLLDGEALTDQERAEIAGVLEEVVLALDDATPAVLRPMFADEAVFWCTHWETPPKFAGKEGGGLVETSGAGSWPALAVLCNDLFVWGMSDCEEVEPSLWDEVAKVHAEHGTWGLQVWVARRRKQVPQGPVLRHEGWQKAAQAMGWTADEAAATGASAEHG